MAGSFSASRIDVSGWTNYSPVTLSFWFNLTSPLKDPERLVGSDDNWEVRVTQDWTPGSPRVANELFASTTQTPPAYSTTVVAANTLYFVVASATYNVSSALYINGVLESTGTCVDNPTGTTFSIGGSSWAPLSSGLNGTVDDVRVYNRILTADEIATMYACKGTDGDTNGLVDRWLMDEGAEGNTMTGTGSVKNMVDGGANGTPNGTPAYIGSFIKKRRMTTWQ